MAAVNAYCAENQHSDNIPACPSGRPLLSRRFRRTLAWHIIRRPRGLVGATIQYGHVRTQIMLGYGGSFASGFPDVTAVEEFLQRLDEILEDQQRLEDGEHVSGPAADTYRQRVGDAKATFAGRVLRSRQQVHAITSNLNLQISPGRGMTCVFSAPTAACELPSPRTADSRRTPALDDCRPYCGNIARTDRDVNELRVDASHVADVVADPLAPPIRHQREEATLHRITEKHDADASPSQPDGKPHDHARSRGQVGAKADRGGDRTSAGRSTAAVQRRPHRHPACSRSRREAVEAHAPRAA
ncbi:hypothetical protein [Micromonospora sp. M71_S20]|uniref:hypothetical protein n=1 Tax=Micromonospora sp. M71_S20 TaxID=592872 RepID=UPI001315599A|nr:hypothetical protein [Micromonospora sp. M71_S20]